MTDPYPQPAPPRGRCPACHAAGPLVVDRVGGDQPRPVVFGCTCVNPPPPVEIR